MAKTRNMGRRRLGGRGLGGVVLLALAAAALLTFLPVLSRPTVAQPAVGAGFSTGRETGLPVPRFVSLKAKQARMRVGPSTDYATAWIYTAPGLPLEIVEEYGHWRKVRDDTGTSGWMYGALLSGRRTAVVAPWLKKPAALRRQPSAAGGIEAELEPRVQLRILSCDGSWCHVSLPHHRLAGFLAQQSIWGAYPGEVVR